MRAFPLVSAPKFAAVSNSYLTIPPAGALSGGAAGKLGASEFVEPHESHRSLIILRVVAGPPKRHDAG